MDLVQQHQLDHRTQTAVWLLRSRFVEKWEASFFPESNVQQSWALNSTSLVLVCCRVENGNQRVAVVSQQLYKSITHKPPDGGVVERIAWAGPCS